MRKSFILGLFTFVSVIASAQYTTYTPLQTPQTKLPEQPKRLSLKEMYDKRNGGIQSPKEGSTQKKTTLETHRVTAYQYDSFAKEWLRIGLKVTITDGVGSSDIITIVAIKNGEYWTDIQPIRTYSVQNKGSEFSYYANLVGGTVYFNY